MPVLPLIDLLILIAWSSLFVGFVQKAAAVTMNARLNLFGLTPFDWALLAAVCLLFALALAARVWVKATEPALLRGRRERNGRGVEVLPDFPDPREQATAGNEAGAPAVPRRAARH